MTTTLVRDSIVGDAWIQQAMAACPPQRILDPNTGQPTGDILTGPVRIAFESLFRLPEKRPDMNEPKYGAHLLFPPNVDFTIFQEEYYKLCGQVFPEHYNNGQYHGLHSPFRDQAEKMKFGGFTPGCIFFNSTSKFKPPVVDARFNPIVDESKIYPGVWVVASVRPYSYGKQPPKPKKGVAFGLQSVMLLGEDTKFGQSGPDAKQQFAGINIAAPVNRPDFSKGMPSGQAPAPAAAIPGYTQPGGMVQQPGYAPPAIPQTHYTPPAPIAAPAANTFDPNDPMFS
ncbi:DUF2815 family protein [Candidatus Dependentiae bacterium]|nr:MAG: DUF2815 family protein [Candidatus Dependentiae bacterium]